MSSKKDTGWSKCSKCEKIFPKKFLIHHTDKCSTDLINHGNSTSFLDTGYIHEGILFAKAAKKLTTTTSKFAFIRQILRSRVYTVYIPEISCILGGNFTEFLIKYTKKKTNFRTLNIRWFFFHSNFHINYQIVYTVKEFESQNWQYTII